MAEGKKYTIKLNEIEMTTVLTALAIEQTRRDNNKKHSQQIEWIIDKFYKAIGV